MSQRLSDAFHYVVRISFGIFWFPDILIRGIYDLYAADIDFRLCTAQKKHSISMLFELIRTF